MKRLLIICAGIASLIVQLNAECSAGKDFECGFESECECWRQGQNGVEDDIDWAVGSQVATFGWSSVPRGRSDTNSTFAYATRDAEHLLKLIPRGAMLVSKSIPCLDQPATLKLWYWKAAFIPQIRVCYKYFDESKVSQCSAEVIGYQPPDWLQLTANLPPINRPFQIVIQAIRLFPFQSAVAIDDITIEGELTCKNKQGLPSSAKPSIASLATPSITGTGVTPSLGVPKAKKGCSDVKMTDSWSGDYNRGVWQPCENGTSCKQPTGLGAATAWDVQGEGTFVLESQDFHMDVDSVLKFQYQFIQKNFTSKLRLCVDALDACPFVVRGSAQTETWSQEGLPLTPGWHKIFFTVTNLKSTDHVKVRRISVRSKDIPIADKPATGCALLLTLIDE